MGIYKGAPCIVQNGPGKSGSITPLIIGVKIPSYIPIYNAISRGPITPFKTSGPSCLSGKSVGHFGGSSFEVGLVLVTFVKRSENGYAGGSAAQIHIIKIVDTPPKFNVEPENDTFQKGSPFPGGHFQVPC